MQSDEHYMRRALELAERGRGCTRPNPMVGCVIVRDGVVLGEGFHERAGGPHAEVHAVDAAKGDLAGATVFVTLEPCSHHGRTPPCAELLVEQRPARVVAAMQDPNPKVSGAGLEALRAAGIDVEVGLLGDAARRMNEAYVKHVSTGLPFVIAKCGMSLDGKIATRTGRSRWITGETSRRKVHEMRNEVDAILVGSRTVMLDDPSLSTRIEDADTHDPIRVLLDAAAYLDADRRVFHVESASPTWVAVTEARDYPHADDVLRLPKGPGGVDMAALAAALGERGVASLLIEGGGTTLASAFEAGIVDKVCFFVAPKIVGGRDAVTPVEGLGCDGLDEAVMLNDMRAVAMGADCLIEAYVRPRADAPKAGS